MIHAPDFVYDAAAATAIGRRELQEDAVAAHFPADRSLGFIVLADGMGGQAAGDVASRIVVDAVTQGLQSHAADASALEADVGLVLRQAMDRANGQLAAHVARAPALHGMGATLVAPLIVANRLYWISVGDSPLYLLRGGRMARLNREHSMADRLDRMVAAGQISRHQADQDPDRDCVTSVLIGADVPEVDCRDRPIDLEPGDILIVASDGLLFLPEARIASIVHATRDLPSAEIGARLMREIATHDDPDQDNVSLCVVKVGQRPRAAGAAADPVRPRRPSAIRRTMVQLQIRRQGDRVTRHFSSESEG